MSGESKLLEKLSLRQNIRNIRQVIKLIVELDKSYLVWNILSVFLSAAMTYGSMILSAYIINSITGKAGARTMIQTAVIACIALSAGASALSLINRRIDIISQLISEKYDALQQEKIMSLDFSLIDSPKLKEIRERIQQDRNWGAGIFSVFWHIKGMLNSLLELIGAVVIGIPMFSYFHGRACAEAVIVFALLGICLVPGVKLYRHFMKKSQYVMFHQPTREEKEYFWNYAWGFALGSSNYKYTNGKDVRIYNAYGIMKFWTYDKLQSKEFRDFYIRRPAAGFAGSAGVGSGLSVIILVGAYFLISMLAADGDMPAGSLILYAGCLTNLLNCMLDMVNFSYNISLAARQQAGIFELLSLSDEMYKGSLPLEKRSDNEYQIEFRNVSFRYPGSEEYALKDFSMTLRVGERLAIVGRNGSGKTTMIKLLCRLYDPQEGEILVNGVDIKKFRHEEYSKLFSVVFQDFVLMALMLAENVAADKEYDAEAVKKCLCDAGFGERLSQMGERGIEKYLYKDYTDEGIEISGGEAQKIAIARAVYKQAPFVLLDEPTAALDPIAESEIYENFDKIAGDKTAIYISHRLSSCKFCDRIAVFDHGRLVQTGSHEKLLADKDGVYAALWGAQAKYYEMV